VTADGPGARGRSPVAIALQVWSSEHKPVIRTASDVEYARHNYCDNTEERPVDASEVDKMCRAADEKVLPLVRIRPTGLQPSW